MWLLSSKIDRQELKHGDHIYCWRQAFIYAHHRIYIGDGKVIHLTRRTEGLCSSLPNSQISDVPCPQCGDHNSSSIMVSFYLAMTVLFSAANSTSSSMESHGFTFLPKSAEGRAHLPLLTRQETSSIAPISSSRKALVNMMC
ncbi:hypothetical protein Q3G72_017977 [Acer saccharum]|nr:hypothetical protein Q3G72_017977 [Acer saccharum]